MLRTKTIEWGDLSATVTEQSGLQAFTDDETFRQILSVIRGEKVTSIYDTTISYKEDLFLMAVGRTTSCKGFKFANNSSSEKQIKAAWKILDELPGGFVRKWYDTILALGKPPMGDPDLVPAAELDDEQKKIQE